MAESDPLRHADVGESLDVDGEEIEVPLWFEDEPDHWYGPDRFRDVEPVGARVEEKRGDHYVVVEYEGEVTKRMPWDHDKWIRGPAMDEHSTRFWNTSFLGALALFTVLVLMSLTAAWALVHPLVEALSQEAPSYGFWELTGPVLAVLVLGFVIVNYLAHRALIGEPNEYQ